MTTHFITAEIDLTADPRQLPQQVDADLHPHGTPLRWAITAVNEATRTATVEAVVTQEHSSAPATAKS